MDTLTLSYIDEELDSSDVAALRFLCRDVLNRKRLETVKDGKDLFMRLEEKGLLENQHFISQLLHTIGRGDLVLHLEANYSQSEQNSWIQADASPILSEYRTVLYQIHEDMTKENLKKMKFMLSEKLGRGPLESCMTMLDVLAEMEKKNLLSPDKLEVLHEILMECDRQLAQKLQVTARQYQPSVEATSNLDFEPSYPISAYMANNPSQSSQSLSVSETQPSRECTSQQEASTICSDSDPFIEDSSFTDQTECYSLTHNPRGTCLILNNENFMGTNMNNRPGTEEDEKVLHKVFTGFGFKVEVHRDVKANEMQEVLNSLGNMNHRMADALVVCVLSHGDKGCVYGVDGKKVSLQQLTQPFRGIETLAGKPKLFFIQACQGSSYQKGFVPCPPVNPQSEKPSAWEEDAGPVSIPWDADFLMGMATVEECKSFRSNINGSIYIQELCRQLVRAASSKEDILTVLTRVNRVVSEGEYLKQKQMPEPKYTLTKKLILTFI